MVDKKQAHVTPKGVLVYPYLNTPDTYKNQSNYRADVRISKAEADKMIAKFLPMLEAYAEEEGVPILNPLPIKQEKDKDKKPLDTYLVCTKMKSSFKNRQGQITEMHPKVVDGKLQRVPRSVNIGGGTEAKVSFTVFPYVMDEAVIEDGQKTSRKVAGLSFRLQGVQVLNLVEGAAGSLGFEEDPEGYQQDFVEESGSGAENY